jgi:hypothetical protein
MRDSWVTMQIGKEVGIGIMNVVGGEVRGAAALEL